MICELLLTGRLTSKSVFVLENDNNRIMLKRSQLYTESGRKINALSHYMM
jgi:hypothetical protein